MWNIIAVRLSRTLRCGIYQSGVKREVAYSLGANRHHLAFRLRHRRCELGDDLGRTMGDIERAGPLDRRLQGLLAASRSRMVDFASRTQCVLGSTNRSTTPRHESGYVSADIPPDAGA